MIVRKIIFHFSLFLCSFYCLTAYAAPNWKPTNNGIKNTGSISTIAFDPTNNNYMLAGADNDGLYQSEDGGHTWKKINNPIWNNREFVEISFHPFNSNIIYIGTSDNGLLQSTDHGATWKTLIKPKTLNAFEVNKQNPSELYISEVGSNGGTSKSSNGGKTWIRITNTLEKQMYYRNIIIDPYNSNHIYLETLSASDFGGRIFESYDEGKNWKRIITGFKLKDKQDAFLYDAEFTAPGVAYVSGIGGFFKSIDNGKTWTPLYLTEKLVSSVLLNPKNPEEFYIYVEDEGLYHSLDNGAHWELTHPAFFSERQDFIRLRSNPDHSVLFVSGPGVGILTSTDGKTFSPLDNGIENLEVTALAIDPTNANRRYVGIKNHGLWVANNGDWEFADKQFTDLDIQNILVNPINPAHVVINVKNNSSIFTTIYTSDDYGKTWKKAEVEISDPKDFVPTKLIMNPIKPNEMFADNYMNHFGFSIWKSIDGGQHWFVFGDLTNNKYPEAINVDAFAINPKNTMEMYVGSVNETGRLIYKSIDGGKTWQQLSFSFGQDVHNRDFNYTPALTIDPIDPKIIYAATLTGITNNDLHLFKTTDSGKTWNLIGKNLPKVAKIRDIIIDDQDHNRIYLATSSGIFISTNGGANWESFNDGLTNISVSCLAQSQNKLFAGTIGSGIFTTNLN